MSSNLKIKKKGDYLILKSGLFGIKLNPAQQAELYHALIAMPFHVKSGQTVTMFRVTCPPMMFQEIVQNV